MNKILKSFSVIAFVAAIALAGTGAYFSDTETSTGNVFTAGAIDLKVDSQTMYNGNKCELVGSTYKWTGNAAYPVVGTACDGTWESTDLGTAQKLFSFSDLKPGDFGSNSISFHLSSNSAYGCLTITDIQNLDNTCTEPESGAEAGCGTDNVGELAENMDLAVWIDDGAGTNGVACNNILDGDEEVITGLFSTFYVPGMNTVVIPVSDNSTGSLMGDGVAIEPGDYCIGFAWTLPFATGNEVQTDSISGDINFYVEQARHNGSYTCAL